MYWVSENKLLKIYYVWLNINSPLVLLLWTVSGNVKQCKSSQTAQYKDKQGLVEYENNTTKGQRRKGGIKPFTEPQECLNVLKDLTDFFFLKAVRDFHLALIIMTNRHLIKANSARSTWWNHVIVQQGLVASYTPGCAKHVKSVNAFDFFCMWTD